MKHWLLLLLSLTLSITAPSLQAAATAEALARYKAWHDVCLQGDLSKIDTQIGKFEKQLNANPKDVLAKAFLGSAYALRAKYGKWGPTKLKYLKRGKKLMEEAVTSAPTDARVRMVRAIAYYKIPERFRVRNTAITDFKGLVPLARAGGGLRVSERQAILYHAALAFREEGVAGAQELMTLCRKLDPKSEFGRLAK